ncbi:hypothetical protein P7C70_g3457, partial [Phenoliferia sp. Uapishka_3]
MEGLASTTPPPPSSSSLPATAQPSRPLQTEDTNKTIGDGNFVDGEVGLGLVDTDSPDPRTTSTPPERSTSPITSPSGLTITDSPTPLSHHYSLSATSPPPPSLPLDDGSAPSFPKNGVLPPELFDTPPTSALFPSPSSSFRPPPDLETPPSDELKARLDERVAAAKRISNLPAGEDAESGEVFAVPAVSTPRKPLESSDSSPSIPPARPSPCLPSQPLSRPPSFARSRAASRASNRGSTSSAHPSPRLPSEAQIASLAAADIWGAPPAMLSTSVLRERAEEMLVIVRDYAFERSDPRFNGEPQPDEMRNSRGSENRASRYSSDSPALGNDAFATSGSSAFSWGFVTSHQTDFPGTEEDDSLVYSEDDAAAGDFIPGIYSAVYDFERELDSEMTIKNGDFVTVYNRECAGWVQAARMDGAEMTGEVGLVPENYLTLVERIDPNDLVGGEDGDSWEAEEEQPSAEERESEPEPQVNGHEPPGEDEDEVSTPRPTADEED